MKIGSRIVLCGFLIWAGGCGTSRKNFRRPDLSYLSRNEAELWDLARYAVAHSRDGGPQSLQVDTIADAGLRRRFSAWGRQVYVVYGAHAQPPLGSLDSVVIFSTVRLSGVQEVIVDFAAKPKDLAEQFHSRKEPYLLRVSERIYYRKKEFPWM